MTSPKLPYRMVIAIDFGTSRSGYALAYSRDERLRELEEQWPDQPFRTPKTLTQLLYAPGQPSRAAAWGFSATKRLEDLQAEQKAAGYRMVRHFKMALAGVAAGPDGPLFDPRDGTPPVPAIPLIAEYLREMKYLILRRQESAQTTRLADNDVYWCLTIPASWGNLQRQWMREAARLAGLIGPDPAEVRRLCLVLEPEAAALFCVRNDVATGGSGLEAGKRFMVVDAGGGTIDLTVHEVTGDGGLDEVVQSSAAHCGSTTIDAAFRDHLAKLFGAQAVVDFQQHNPREWNDLMNNWEMIKCAYEPGVTQRSNVSLPFPLIQLLHKSHLPALERFRKQQKDAIDHVRLMPAEMDGLFAPTIDAALGAVQRQFAELDGRHLHYLFLVGGLAQSPALRKTLEQFCQERRIGFVAPRPHEAGVAVVKGAVLFGLNPEGIARRSRYTCGVRVVTPWGNGDPPQLIIDKGDKGPWIARFKVFVEKGELVPFDHEKIHRFAPMAEDSTRATLEFYATDRDVPPYFDPTICRQIARLPIDLPAVPPGVERELTATFHFGRTEIAAEVIDSATGRKWVQMLEFKNDADKRQGA